MKYIYKKAKHKAFSKIRSLSEAKRKKTSKRKRARRNIESNNLSFAQRKSRLPLEPNLVTVPAEFSLLKNREEVLKFFSEVTKIVRKKCYVRLNLRDISVLEPEALLYLLAWMDSLEVRGYARYISGNTPKSPALKSLLACSGFYQYVHTSEPLGNSEKILKIRSGTNVQNVVAKSVKDFAQKHLGEFKSKKRSCLYPTILECMANTFNHAYKRAKRAERRKWWLMAVMDDAADCVHFTFLDNGRGIPATVARRLELSEIKISDSELILSALNGEYRTRTKQNWRGKGLPKIYSYLKSGDISNLVIISDKGHYESNSGMVSYTKTTFPGTLLSWNYTRS